MCLRKHNGDSWTGAYFCVFKVSLEYCVYYVKTNGQLLLCKYDCVLLYQMFDLSFIYSIYILDCPNSSSVSRCRRKTESELFNAVK